MAGSGTTYAPRPMGVDAPQVSGPGAPVQVNPEVAASGWESITTLADNATKYVDAMQRADEIRFWVRQRPER